MRQRTKKHTLAWHLWCRDSDLTWLKQPLCGRGQAQQEPNSAESLRGPVSDSRRPPVKWSRCGLQGPVLEPQAACWCGTYTSGCSQTQFLLCETGEIQRAVSVRSLELPRRSSGEPRQRHEVDGAELSALWLEHFWVTAHMGLLTPQTQTGLRRKQPVSTLESANSTFC